jgi:DmsE family decaheme c-type cytochrome
MKDGRVLAPALLGGMLALAFATAVQADNKAAPKPSAQEKSNKMFAKKVIGKPSDYAGSEQCRDCHADQFKSFEAGPHHATLKNKDVSQQGCESCHGPAKAHVDSGGEALETLVRFKKVNAEQASAQCLDCHQGGEHTNFARSEHMKSNVGCVQCHSAHSPKVKSGLLIAAQPELCYTCHVEARAEFSKPFHHRVNEKLIGCNDCHNPHGGYLQRNLRTTAAQDQTCFTCHAEKAGPFVFEHAPVKTEGCVSCHTPHGSVNPRLLKRSNVNLLCLECHTFTVDSAAPAIPSFHNQAQKYQACTMCHTQIHGSNQSEVFFK